MKKQTKLGLMVLAFVTMMTVGYVKKAKAMIVIDDGGQVSQVLGDEQEKQVKETKQEVRKEQERVRQEVRERVEKKEQVMEKAKDNQKFDKEIFKNGVKIKIEKEDGKLMLKKEYQNGKEEKIGEDKMIKVKEKRGEELTIENDKQEAILRRGKVKARTNFPLSINPDTNELVVTTPAGSKVVSVLPDTAVKTLVDNGVLSTVEKDSTGEAVAKLTEENNQLMYEVQGENRQKILGLFSVNIPKKVKISAQTGKIVKVEQPFFAKILDLFAF